MQIELKSIKIRDLIDGYIDDPDTGVKGYHGKLDIRPPYQREFRYDEKQQQAVVEISVSSVMTKSSNKPLWKPSSKAFRSTSCIGAWM